MFEFAPSVKEGTVSVSAELHHFSLIVYTIPVERARAVIPNSILIEESVHNGGQPSWLSITSFLDQGSQRDGQGVFEQTIYRLHVLAERGPAQYLLGISLGSLSAVAIRNFWPLPWHLSAMEFEVAYDRFAGRYCDYRLQTQSQWANANWEISDTGESLLPDHINYLKLPASFFAGAFNNYFSRRDGSLGLYQARYYDWALTAGRLKHARSDLLLNLGLLKRDELLYPTMVAIQRRISCQIFSPTILGDNQSTPFSFSPLRF
ncbi:MAG: DUF2071 domain-containing protein [Acidobacteria bacterium]|nr:DUF2071 domain-containing protein [Acidobacteriota bacterium]